MTKHLEEKRKEEAKEASDSVNVIKEILESDNDVYSIVADVKFSYAWILNSRCSFHMCPHREYFDRYKACDASFIQMGDDFVSKVMKIGIVKVKMYDGTARTLTNVRHVPKLRR